MIWANIDRAVTIDSQAADETFMKAPGINVSGKEDSSYNAAACLELESIFDLFFWLSSLCLLGKSSNQTQSKYTR